jgi:uncharacterized iron-regulated membrane protein
MSDWFRFGGVRGILGMIVLALQIMLLSAVPIQSLQPTIGWIVAEKPMNATANAMYVPFMEAAKGWTTYGPWMSIGMLIIAIAASIVVAYVLSGAMYWFGSKVLKWLKVRINRPWLRAVAVGVIGMLTLGIIVGAIVLMFISPSMVALLAVATIPAIIYEVGWAIVTGIFYERVLGEPIPE